MVQLNKHYFAIDVGGTFIKGGIIDEKGTILVEDKIPTDVHEFNFDLSEKIFHLCDRLKRKSGMDVNYCDGIGIGLPGLIDSNLGIIRHSGNLGIENYPIVARLSAYISVPIKIANDADIATLAEFYYGAGKVYKNFVFVTIGTGIGGGAVIGGVPLSSNCNYSGEFGHMKLHYVGKCTCGQTGCFEALASTSALVNSTKKAMRANPTCQMSKKVPMKDVTGKTVFDFLGIDPIADEVFEEYISYLGRGIVNLVNIFSPDVVVVGGAISAQRSKLLKPLEEYVNKNIYARKAGKQIKILPSKETGKNGILGARCLFGI